MSVLPLADIGKGKEKSGGRLGRLDDLKESVERLWGGKHDLENERIGSGALPRMVG